ncbi:heavy-metal-associated domain-containing protein [uncultured Polaribacter sp.]|uniref:heavy-metal-associated domain-containing protein n=1 Tax=uncultured Polaribacter sp. TaxID=174711 RepID=UPI002609F400|nr:heavy-metal-associated domain-containing protein [uncultured Polaribacter sp.]
MKKIIVVFSLCLIGFSFQAQEKKEIKKNKNAKITLTVDGICGMCKKRIETASLKTKGVKFAIWDVKTHQLNLILDERKTAVAAVQKNILAIGHDILLEKGRKLVSAKEAYESVHPCCKYRDSEIVLEHDGGFTKQEK